jgi:hypothetical protein
LRDDHQFVEPLAMDTKTGKAFTVQFQWNWKRSAPRPARSTTASGQDRRRRRAFWRTLSHCLEHRLKPKNPSAGNSGEIKTRVSFLGYDNTLKNSSAVHRSRKPTAQY